MQRSGNPMNTRWSTATASAGEHRLPSLASTTPAEEPEFTEIRLPISNCGGEVVNSPVKNWGVQHHAIGTRDAPVHLGKPAISQGPSCSKSTLEFGFSSMLSQMPLILIYFFILFRGLRSCARDRRRTRTTMW